MKSAKNSLLAVVAARSGSKGLPDKNVKKLLGRCLLEWPIMAALNSKAVTKLLLSTDSPAYASLAEECGATVPFLRPTELADDGASSVDVVLHALDYLEANGEAFDYVVLLEPTSPMTEGTDIDSAFSRLVADKQGATSIVGVSELITHHPVYALKVLGNQKLKPAYSKSFSSLPRRQDIDCLHFLDGSLYISKVSTLKCEKTFYTENTLGHVMPSWKALEVDSLTDFLCIEAIMKHRFGIK
jgi:N-acylneuraminate cytidylyltransferase/CMP-N,N'-diacetyllegionaminic acid synthase